MAFNSVKKHLLPSHPFEMENGKTYMVPPPNARDGLLLRSFVAVSANAANGHTSKDEDLQILMEEGDRELTEIALTRAVVDEMTADGVPEAHIKQAAVYGLYLWTLGEESADRYFAVVYGVGGNEVEETAAPKAPKA